jgi:hypothetical protein
MLYPPAAVRVFRRRLFLAECLGHLIRKWLDEIGERGALAGHQKHVDRHAGDQGLFSERSQIGRDFDRPQIEVAETGSRVAAAAIAVT